MGKQLRLKVRRTQLANDEVWKLALKTPKKYVNSILYVFCAVTYCWHLFRFTPKIKNKKKTEVGETLGRIHLKKQNLDNMGVKRVGALRTPNSST